MQSFTLKDTYTTWLVDSTIKRNESIWPNDEQCKVLGLSSHPSEWLFHAHMMSQNTRRSTRADTGCGVELFFSSSVSSRFRHDALLTELINTSE